MYRFKPSLLSASCLLAFTSLSVQSLPTSYEIIDLGAIENIDNDGERVSSYSAAFDINGTGNVAGTSEAIETFTSNSTDFELLIASAVSFQEGMAPQKVIPDGQTIGLTSNASNSGSYALGIDNLGSIVGWGLDEVETFTYADTETETCAESSTTSFFTKAFYQTGTFGVLEPTLRNGEPLDANIHEFMTSRAFDVAGDYLVGQVTTVLEKDSCNNVTATQQQAMVYDTNLDTMVTFDPVGENDNRSAAVKMSENGKLVGNSYREQRDAFGNLIISESNAFVGNVDGTRTVVSGLEEDSIDFLWGINDSGTYAVGSSNYQATVYNVTDDQMIGIGYIDDNFTLSEAFGVNDSGVVVGTALVSRTPSVYNAFVYDSETSQSLSNLNDLIDCDSGWILSEARAINNNGWIVGTGSKLVEVDGRQIGEVRAFLMKPRDGQEPDRSCDNNISDSKGGSVHWWMLGGLMLLIRRRVRQH